MGKHEKKGTLKSILLGAFILIIAFCAAFLLTLKFVIEPAYTYVKTENVQTYIAKLEQEITQKNQEIENLQTELDIYKSSKNSKT